MTDKKTGGPAFPSPTDGMLDNEGMTLRDYFAAKAIQVMAANEQTTFDADAEAAYMIADAMLKARQQ